MHLSTFRIPALGITALLLAACSETTNSNRDPVLEVPSEAQALRTGSPEDEQACELAVTQQTNNPDVITLSSDFSEANTIVILGVGQERAKWRCLVSKGRVAEVTSMTDEGAL